MSVMPGKGVACAALFGAGVLLIAPSAWGACSIASTQNVAFGDYDPLVTGPTESTAVITIECTNLLSVGSETFDILLGTGGAGSYAPRAMSEAGGDSLDYNLYRDSARSEVWGDGSGATFVVTDTIGGLLNVGTASEDYTVYARLFSMQDVTASNYTDSITVTLEVQ